MGTTADKLAYLNDTKTAIKNAIVAKGVAVPDGTTFRAYADKIGSIPTGDAKVELVDTQIDEMGEVMIWDGSSVITSIDDLSDVLHSVVATVKSFPAVVGIDFTTQRGGSLDSSGGTSQYSLPIIIRIDSSKAYWTISLSGALAREDIHLVITKRTV